MPLEEKFQRRKEVLFCLVRYCFGVADWTPLGPVTGVIVLRSSPSDPCGVLISAKASSHGRPEAPVLSDEGFSVTSDVTRDEKAVSVNSVSVFAGVLVIRALLFRVSIKAPDCWKL